MVTITISLTNDQARRLFAAATFVGPKNKVEDLVLGNALAHLDDWEQSESEIRHSLRDGIRIYAQEKLAAPVDANLRLRQIGVDQIGKDVSPA